MSQNKMVITRGNEKHEIVFVWTVSRGRYTYGYNIVTAYVDGGKVGRCNGGGYDMEGVAISGWLSKKVLPDAEFYGLSWHDPHYKKPQEIADREAAGESLGLEAYQDYYKESSPKRTDRHTIPNLSGGTGLSNILRGAGYDYWSINEYKVSEIKDYLNRNVSAEELKGKAWETVARQHGFRRGRRTRNGNYIWERWPV